MAKVLRWTARIFGALYLVALILWAIGTYGLLGQDKDPLSAVFLIPLGLPWNQLGGGMLAALGAPLINLIILVLLARWARRRPSRT